MRKLGGLIKLLPVTYVMMLVGSLALAGFPYLSGFYSKDLVWNSVRFFIIWLKNNVYELFYMTFF